MTPAEESLPLPAGGFSAWLRDMRAALAGRGGMNVACGDCRGCCTSHYYVKIRADESASLARIAELAGEHHLEPGPPGDPRSRLLGHQANGHCRMMMNRECTIYADRPETCRSYDCRVFAAAGMNAGEGKTEINERVARWRFEYPTPRDRAEHAAVTAAAKFLRQHPVRFPTGQVPSRPAEIAVLAIKCYEAFLSPPDDHREIVADILAAVRGFDERSRKGMTVEAGYFSKEVG